MDSADRGRAEFIAGFRAQAGFLAAHPALPVPIPAFRRKSPFHTLQPGTGPQWPGQRGPLLVFGITRC